MRAYQYIIYTIIMIVIQGCTITNTIGLTVLSSIVTNETINYLRDQDKEDQARKTCNKMILIKAPQEVKEEWCGEKAHFEKLDYSGKYYMIERKHPVEEKRTFLQRCEDFFH